MKKFSVLALFSFLLFGSCSSGTSPSEVWETQGLWDLVGFGKSSIPPNQTYNIQFSDDGRVNIRADCNTCFGGYETRGEAITIGPALGCTRAFCGPMSLFDEYVAAVSSVTRFVRRGDGLDLEYPGGILSFEVVQ